MLIILGFMAILLKDVPMSSLLSSSNQFDNPKINKSKLMCYVNPTDGFPCNGTDGVPLVCKSSKGIWHQYGMLDSSVSCRKGSPGCYTRISFYYDWLQKQIHHDINVEHPEQSGNYRYVYIILYPICGKPSIQPVFYGQDNFKILGGDEAKPHSWPWQVSLQRFEKGQLNHICGGTIIAKNKILCAAHCLLKLVAKPNLYKVIVGSHEKDGSEPMARIINIKSFSTPDSFDWNKNLTHNDIMVITLTEELMYDEYASPICLAKNRAVVNSICYVTGWGHNVNAASDVSSRVLTQVDIAIQETSLCKQLNIHGIVFNDSKMLCAGHRLGGRNSCCGDSGGPLICLESGKWLQFGIVSQGVDCSQKNQQGVYTSVSYYYDWIRTQINADFN